jgi:hypothetical protein
MLPTASRAVEDGLTVHIDPVTGRFSPPPQDHLHALTDELGSALSTSAEGLKEVPSPVAGGGVMVSLEGRFRNTITATAGSQGEMSTSCATTAADGANTAGDRGTTTPDDGTEGGEIE